eukprot:scaffold63_cov306-Pinguiococcus_pyrenoidosus.AAC.73
MARSSGKSRKSFAPSVRPSVIVTFSVARPTAALKSFQTSYHPLGKSETCRRHDGDAAGHSVRRGEHLVVEQLGVQAGASGRHLVLLADIPSRRAGLDHHGLQALVGPVVFDQPLNGRDAHGIVVHRSNEHDVHVRLSVPKAKHLRLCTAYTHNFQVSDSGATC